MLRNWSASEYWREAHHFLSCSFGCALAGTLWLATSITFQPRQYFGVQLTAYMIFMVLVGGLGTFEGPILGAIIFFLIEYFFGQTGVWYLIGLGAAAVIFALFLPRGIWGSLEQNFANPASADRLSPAYVGFRFAFGRT